LRPTDDFDSLNVGRREMLELKLITHARVIGRDTVDEHECMIRFGAANSELRLRSDAA